MPARKSWRRRLRFALTLKELSLLFASATFGTIKLLSLSLSLSSILLRFVFRFAPARERERVHSLTPLSSFTVYAIYSLSLSLSFFAGFAFLAFYTLVHELARARVRVLFHLGTLSLLSRFIRSFSTNLRTTRERGGQARERMYTHIIRTITLYIFISHARFSALALLRACFSCYYAPFAFVFRERASSSFEQRLFSSSLLASFFSFFSRSIFYSLSQPLSLSLSLSLS